MSDVKPYLPDEVLKVIVSSVAETIFSTIASCHKRIAVELAMTCDASMSAHDVAIKQHEIAAGLWVEYGQMMPQIVDAIATGFRTNDVGAAVAKLPGELPGRFVDLPQKVAALTTEHTPFTPALSDDGAIKLRIISPRAIGAAAYAAPLIKIGSALTCHIVPARCEPIHATIQRRDGHVWIMNLEKDGRGVTVSTEPRAGSISAPVTTTRVMQLGEWFRIGDTYVALDG